MDHMSMNVGQSIVASGVSIRELLVIKPHQVQDRCVQIVDVNPVLYGSTTKVVGRPVAHATLYPTASHPNRIAVMVMVSAKLAFRGGGAAELTAPDQ